MKTYFGSELQMARKSYGLTQKALADMLNVATGTVQQWELGTRTPRIEQVTNISSALNIPLSVLFQAIVDDMMPDTLPPHEYGIAISDEEFKSFSVLSSESRLLNAYNKLNNEGQDKVIDYTETLVKAGDYLRHPETPPEGQ